MKAGGKAMEIGNAARKALAVASLCLACAAAWAEDAGIFVKKIDGLSPDFIRGVDVSSVLSLERSGVVFKDSGGAPQDIFQTLKESGVNSVRVRVWNKPFTADGKGYGGGDCDINAAIEIGKRAAARGLWTMLDFHYSDFWADPAKQQAPRAWKGLAIESKADVLYVYTKECVKKALGAGVDLRMVQLGNETTGALCGETNWISIAKLMNAGGRAVREAAAERGRDVKIALHFTNPEKAGSYERFAMILEKQKVDYDVFATSYYPWWHGSLENLAGELRKTFAKSGKKILCAEFSYAYTYQDGDGFPNTISRDTVCDKPYPITVQGQAAALRDAMAAIASLGDAGIGLYYWEPAWIPVPGSGPEERKALWEKYGSGWASSYAAEYDPKDAGKFYGGSSWDNQALFDSGGKPLKSLSVWRLAASGASTALKPDYVAEETVRTRVGDPVVLPAAAQVIFNDGSSRPMAVLWKDEGMRAGTGKDAGRAVKVSAMPGLGVADYDLEGFVSYTDSDGGLSAIRTTARVSVIEKNYLDNPGFEDADLSMWKLDNIGGKTSELFVQDKVSDAKTGSKSLHFWSKDKVSFTVEQTVRGLAPGKYKFSLAIQGGDAKNQDMGIYALADGAEYGAKTDVDGWRNFRQPSISGITVGSGTVTVGARISCDANGWGTLDDFVLSPED
jgi:arabinogalactan endo-1,4-beta-galactosidase